MGALPHGIQKLFYGKPKAVLQDSWDRQLGRRDERVLQEWQDRPQSKVSYSTCSGAYAATVTRVLAIWVVFCRVKSSWA